MQQYDVVVIGAGAAGLMCAASAGYRGRSVLVLDHANKAGKKILMSGGGRCNFTNLNSTPTNFLSDNPHYCISALKRYTPQDFLELVDRHGVEYEEKAPGQLFCRDSAKDVLNVLLTECEWAGAEIRLKTQIQKVREANGGYQVVTGSGVLALASEYRLDAARRTLWWRSVPRSKRSCFWRVILQLPFIGSTTELLRWRSQTNISSARLARCSRKPTLL